MVEVPKVKQMGNIAIYPIENLKLSTKVTPVTTIDLPSRDVT
jgi:hypothetical protein